MDETHSYLFKGEEVALVVRPHPVVLLKPGLLPLASLALFAAAPGRFTLAVLIVVLARFSWQVGMWWLDRYVLTTDRILRLTGIITKRVVTLPLGKITDLIYSRTLLGRLLGYGSLNFESAGQQDFGQIDYLPDPDDFYRTVMSLALGPKEAGEGEGEGEGSPPAEAAAKPQKSGVNPDGRLFNTDEVPVVRNEEGG